MSLILAIPALEFNIGNYQFNAYTYPAWSSLILQVISFVLNIFYIRRIELETKETGNNTEEKNALSVKKKNIFISPGVILILVIFFFDGYFLSVLAYSLPIVMLEVYEWFTSFFFFSLYC